MQRPLSKTARILAFAFGALGWIIALVAVGMIVVALNADTQPPQPEKRKPDMPKRTPRIVYL